MVTRNNEREAYIGNRRHLIAAGEIASMHAPSSGTRRC
jgi:hypothetical protein